MRDKQSILTEKKQLRDRWLIVDQVEGMNYGQFFNEFDDYLQYQIATLMENQRLLATMKEKNNEKKRGTDEFREFSEMEKRFNRLSPELVGRVMRKLAFKHLVNFQAQLAPADLIFYEQYQINQEKSGIERVEKSDPVLAKTRWLKSVFNLQENTGDMEKEQFAVSVANEIDREIAKDLVLNVATKAKRKYENFEQFYSVLVEVTGVIRRKCGAPNQSSWLFTSEELAQRIAEEAPYYNFNFDSSHDIYKVGVLNNWAVYVDKEFAKKQVLMGVSGDTMGYWYSGYLPLDYSEGVIPWLRDDHEGNLLTRYGKKLLRNGGSKRYALIDFED